MNVGSLFSGAGLMDWGLTLAGFEHAWFCERDPYCRAVLERRWPGVPVYEDVEDVWGLPRSANERVPSVPGIAEPVDLIAGGFPCQDISSLGEKAGIDGLKSGLWGEFARVVGELRPKYVLVENVPDLLARGMGRVLGDLAALGYDAEWGCLSAREFGAPIRGRGRARLFVVAYADGGGLGGEGIPREARRKLVARPPRSSGPLLGVSGSASNHWNTEPGVGRVADGVPHRVDRLRALGNGVVPQVAQWIGERILEREAVSGIPE